MPHCCHTTPSSTATNHQHPRSRLDISTLQSAIHFCHQHSLAASTHKLYGTGIQRQLSFCQSINHTPTPTFELTLLLFVAHTSQSQLSLSTIKVYLSAVHSLHLTSGFLGVFNTQSTPRLGQMLQGIKRYQACSRLPTIRLPITIQIMRSLKAVLARNHKDYQNIMMWAVCCIAFFGCLRCSEFTAPNQTSYDPTIHLSYSDVVVDSKISPSMVFLHIKQSMTDTTREGAQVVLGLTGKEACPVKVLLPYVYGSQGCTTRPPFYYSR